VTTLLSVADLRVEFLSRTTSTGVSSNCADPLSASSARADSVRTHPVRADSTLAVGGVSFSIARGETLALVGESGSGKTSTALALLRLYDGVPGARVSGRILLEGRDLAQLSERELRSVRGARVSMVFQEPSSALDPVFSVGDPIVETLRAHRDLSRREARARAIELLRNTGVADPERVFASYPHELSGGMRQRALIAAAIACDPVLLLADEPTSALDATVQAEILELLCALQAASGMGMLFITHDLALVARIAQRTAVMHEGRIVEQGPTDQVLRAPSHPYTAELVRCARAT
jgi:ABC-type dipeptide/oligopeptide/nickel transport system ATPase component